MTVKGKVVREELSGGVWIFEADDGNRYQLNGGDGSLLKDGQRATVTGEVDRNAMSIGMIGEILKVKSYKLD
jgi:hypothetical protein